MIRFLHNELLFLRPLEAADATTNYLSWLNDSEVTIGMVSGRYPSTQAQLIRFIEGVNADPNAVMLAICLNEGGQHVGNIKLDRFDYPSGTCELGLMIGDKAQWGKGIAKAACRLIIEYAFHTLNMRKVSLTVYSNNPAAVHVYRSLGFQEEGCLKKHVFSGGEYVDKLWMSLFKSDYGQ